MTCIKNMATCASYAKNLLIVKWLDMRQLPGNLLLRSLDMVLIIQKSIAEMDCMKLSFFFFFFF
jgi:hypothetical protein